MLKAVSRQNTSAMFDSQRGITALSFHGGMP